MSRENRPGGHTGRTESTYNQDIALINRLVENGFVQGACHTTGKVLGLQPLDSDDLPGGTTYRDIPQLNANTQEFAARLSRLVTPVDHGTPIYSSAIMEHLAALGDSRQGDGTPSMTSTPSHNAMIMAARHAIARVGSLNVNPMDSRLTAFLPEGVAIEFRTPDISVLVQCLHERGYYRQPDDDLRGPLSCKLAGSAADRRLSDVEVRLQKHLRIAEGIGGYSDGHTQLIPLPPRSEW